MQSANPSEVLLVLGMHRSGTSAVSRIFNLLGFAAPKTLMGANKSNQTGHWESTRIARLNDEILRSFDLSWSDWLATDVSRMRAQAREAFETDIINTVSHEFPPGRPIVLKDPRISRIFDLYNSALTARDIPIRVVTPVRNPLSVIESLKARNGMSDMDAGMLWLRQMLDAVDAGNGHPRTFVGYEALLEKPIDTIRTMLDRLDLTPPYALDSVEDQILGYLDSELAHHNFSTVDVAHNAQTSGRISDTYDALLVLCNDPNNETALARLASLRAELDQANELLSTVSRGSTSAFTAALEQTEQELESKQAEIEILNENIADFREAATVSEAQIAEAIIDAEEWQRRFKALQSAHDKLDNDLECAREQAQELDWDVENLKSKLRTSNQAFDDACAERDKLARERKKIAAERDAAISTRRAREKELRQLQRQFYRLKDELSWSKEIIQGYETSTSWKISAPLRLAIRLGRRLKSGGTRSATTADLPGKPSGSDSGDSGSEPSDNPVKSPQTAVARNSSAAGPDNLVRNIALLERSSAFDKAFYLAQHPEVSSHPHGAEGHYLTEGWRRGYRPNPTFDTKAYLAAHPDVVDANLCPLVHYIQSGGSAPREHLLNVDGSMPADQSPNSNRIAVFTAISNGYDDLKEPDFTSENVDFFVFTDGDVPAHSAWKTRPFEFISHDPTRTARFIKTHPHLYFGEYDWSIWVDANLQLAAPAEHLLPTQSNGVDFYTWLHPLRSCVYEEADECIKRGKDDNGTIKAHVSNLREQHFPEQFGLYETSVLVSRMGVENIETMYNAWWAEIAKWSKRDQLSLPTVVKNHGITVGKLAREKICMRTDPRFVYYRHASR